MEPSTSARTAAGYVLASGNTRRRVRVHGTTRKEALAKLTEKIATSTRGIPVPSAQGSVAAYLTYWLENIAVHQLRTTCQCCARSIDARRDEPRCCAVGSCCSKLLSPLTLTYIHSVLKYALEHAVREEEMPRNVARNVRTGTRRLRRFEPLTADEARQFLTPAR